MKKVRWASVSVSRVDVSDVGVLQMNLPYGAGSCTYAGRKCAMYPRRASGVISSLCSCLWVDRQPRVRELEEG